MTAFYPPRGDKTPVTWAEMMLELNDIAAAFGLLARELPPERVDALRYLLTEPARSDARITAFAQLALDNIAAVPSGRDR
jgi:hypothetical protein